MVSMNRRYQMLIMSRFGADAPQTAPLATLARLKRSSGGMLIAALVGANVVVVLVVDSIIAAVLWDRSVLIVSLALKATLRRAPHPGPQSRLGVM